MKAAYNKAQYIAERVKMMQQWADYLDAFESGTNIIPLKKIVAMH